MRSTEFTLRDDGEGDATVLRHVAGMLGFSVSVEPFASHEEPEALNSYKLGKGYLAQRDLSRIDAAISSFEQATAKDPRFAQAYAYLAFAYSLKYRKTRESLAQGKAMQAYAKALNLDNRLPRAHLALGSILEDTGSTTGAVDEFKQALSLDPTDSDVRSLLSIAYLEDGKIADAKRVLEEAIKQDPLAWFNYHDLGYIHYRIGELTEAENEFRKAVARAPDNSLANGVLASMCICLGRYDEAENIANNVLKFRKSAMADENLALVYEHRGSYSDAIKMLQDATRRRSNIDEYWLKLGDAFALLGKKGEAITPYREGLKQVEDYLKSKPNDREFLARLAFYHAKLGQKDQALREVQQALAVVPSVPDPDIPIILARVYELTGKRKEALDVLRSASRNKCVRAAVERIPDFASLRSDRQYLDILNQVGSL